MIVAYTYKNYKDVHTIQNDEVTLSIQYTVTKLDCDSPTILGQVTLTPDQVATLTFATQGTYSVLVEPIDGGAVESETFEIIHYNSLLVSLIYYVNLVLCGCTDCKTEFNCNDYLASYMKAFTFLNVKAPLYDAYFATFIQNSMCILSEEANCVLLREKVYGEYASPNTIAQILSFHYLAFYYKDLSLAVDAEEIAYVNTKYNFDKISSCIKKIGVIPVSPV